MKRDGTSFDHCGLGNNVSQQNSHKKRLLQALFQCPELSLGYGGTLVTCDVFASQSGYATC